MSLTYLLLIVTLAWGISVLKPIEIPVLVVKCIFCDLRVVIHRWAVTEDFFGHVWYILELFAFVWSPFEVFHE